MPLVLIAAENLSDLVGFKVKVYKHKILTALMVDVVVYVFRHTHGDEAIVECTV
jgi:hypothetical protein